MTFVRTFLLVVAFGNLLPGASFGAPPDVAKPTRFPVWHIQQEGNPSVVLGMFLQDVGSKIAICGAFWPEDARQAKKAVQNSRFAEGTVKVKGEIIQVRLNVFPFYETRDAAGNFRCVVSDRLWQGPYEIGDLDLLFR